MTRCPQQQKVRINAAAASSTTRTIVRVTPGLAAAQRQHAADPEKFPAAQHAAREQQQPKQLFGLVRQDRSRIFFHFTC